MAYQFGNQMMGWLGGMGFLMFLTWLVWTTVGVLASVWLWQHIGRK